LWRLMYYRHIGEPVEILPTKVAEDTEKIFADIFEHVPYEQLPHFGDETFFALEENCAELRAIVDATSWRASTLIRQAINAGAGAIKPSIRLSAVDKEILDGYAATADVSFNCREVLLDGVSGLLHGIVEISECQVDGSLSIGGLSIEVPPKSFFTVTLDGHADFNTDRGHMLSLGYDANSRELMLRSPMATHVGRGECHRIGGCMYEAAVEEMPFAYLNPTPPGSVTMGSILVRTQNLLHGQIDLSVPTQTEVEALTFNT
jgi:hypothetical protein